MTESQPEQPWRLSSFRLETAKEDYRIHCEELERQLIEVQHRNNELTSLAEESRALKDELDVLRFECGDFH